MATVTYGCGDEKEAIKFLEKERTYSDSPLLWMTSGACFSDFYPYRVRNSSLFKFPTYFVINGDKKSINTLIKYLNENSNDFELSLIKSNGDAHLVSILVHDSKYPMTKVILEYLLLVVLRILEKTEYHYNYEDMLEKYFDPKNPLDSIVNLSSKLENSNHSILETRVKHKNLLNGNLLKCLSIDLIESTGTFLCAPRWGETKTKYTLEEMFKNFIQGWASTYYLGQTKVIERLLSQLK